MACHWKRPNEKNDAATILKCPQILGQRSERSYQYGKEGIKRTMPAAGGV